MGGIFQGGRDWNKKSSELDKCFKLYYLREGTAKIVGETDEFILQGPAIFFVNGYRILSQQCENKMLVEWLHFQPESVYLSHILVYNSCVRRLDDGLLNTFEPLFQSLEAYFSGNLTSDELRVLNLEFQALVQMAIAQVLRPLENEFSGKDGDFQRLLPALEYINRHYADEITLAGMAKQCHLSPNYFHSIFSVTFETSPNNYVKNLRLQEAIRQLSYTSKQVKEIAFAVGYQDEAYFSRIFSKTFGVSPGKYRMQQKGNLL